MVGTTIGAQNGVLFKGGDILERAKDVDTVVFDKTGTLTKGEMELTDVVVFDGDGQPITDGGQLTGRDRLSENDVLRLAATAESGSEHPRPGHRRRSQRSRHRRERPRRLRKRPRPRHPRNRRRQRGAGR